MVGIGAVQPPEGLAIGAGGAQRGEGPLQRVEFAHPTLHATMLVELQQPPRQLGVVVPLLVHRQLAAHEQQRHPRGRPLHPEQHPQVGGALPVVAGHLRCQRGLAVHHLVVGQRQHETLRGPIHRTKRQVVVVVAPMHAVALQIVERVVHPPQVPLEVEAQSAMRSGCGHPGPGGGLLGDHQHAGCRGVDLVVEVTDERDGLEVLASAMHVRHPLAVLAAVVAIQHRRHRIDPQPVDMVALDPPTSRRHEKGPHLVSAVIEHPAAPLGVTTEARIRVFEQRLTVEVDQPERILGKVRRHPIEDHADTRLMELVDEGCEIVRGAKTRGRSEEPGHVVAPRAAEGVFHHRHELDVGEAQFAAVRGEL